MTTLKPLLMATTTWWTFWIYHSPPSGLIESTPTWRWGTKKELLQPGNQESDQTEVLSVCLCPPFRLKTGLGWWGMWFCTAVSGMICTLVSRTASLETQMSTTTGTEKEKSGCLVVDKFSWLVDSLTLPLSQGNSIKAARRWRQAGWNLNFIYIPTLETSH